MSLSDSVRSVVDRYPVLLFFGLAVALSWIVWIPALLLLPQEAVGPVVMVGAFGPAVAGAILIRAAGGSLRAWVRDAFVWRVPLRWYAVAIGFPLALAAATAVAVWLGGTELDPAVLSERLPFVVGSFLVVLFVGGGQEEFGWRGYALPRLQDRTDATVASVVIGVVWALWHLPLVVLESGLYPDRPFGTYFVFVVAASVVFTWLYNETGGSIVLPMLMHAGINTAGGLVPVPAEALGGIDESISTLSYAVVAVAVALILLAARDRETLSRDDLGPDVTGRRVGDVDSSN